MEWQSMEWPGGIVGPRKPLTDGQHVWFYFGGGDVRHQSLSPVAQELSVGAGKCQVTGHFIVFWASGLVTSVVTRGGEATDDLLLF